MMKYRKILMILMSLALILSALPASAASGVTVWAINDSAQPVSASYMGDDWIGYMSFGQDFILLKTKGDYAQVRNPKGKTGWVMKEYLDYYNPCRLNQTMYVQASGDILWPQADFYADEPIRLEKGDTVLAVGITPWKVWYRVLIEGKYYYVPCQLLAEVPAPEEGRSLIAEQRYVFGSGVDMYKTPDETTDPFTHIDDGSIVRLLEFAPGDSGGVMAKIRTEDGQVGYAHLANLVHLYPH